MRFKSEASEACRSLRWRNEHGVPCGTVWTSASRRRRRPLQEAGERGDGDFRLAPQIELEVTEVAVADVLASAVELVMGKATGVDAAIIRGVDPAWFRDASVRAELVRPAAEDLFR